MAVREIKSIQRCFEILSAFRDAKAPKLDVQQISEITNIPNSSLYRYLQTLSSQNVLDYDVHLKKYTLGPLILSLGSIAYKHNDIALLARPIMEEICAEVQESVFLTAVKDYQAVCLERIEWQQHSIRLIVDRGDTFPLHVAATGKILMAFLPVEKQEKIISKGLKKFTENTLTDPMKLRKSLNKIREDGFAFTDQEHNPGAMAISAPVFDSINQIAAGLCIAAPVDRFIEKDIASNKALIINCARRLSELIGHSCREHEMPKKKDQNPD